MITELDVFEQSIFDDMKSKGATDYQIESYISEYRARKVYWKDWRKYLENIKSNGTDAWLVYRYKDQIKVHKGKLGINLYWNDHGTWRYHTNVPQVPMVVTSKGKVLCLNESDIPEAIEMIKNYYVKKRSEVLNISLKSISNITKIIGGNENE